MNVKIQKLFLDATIPTRGSPESAGLDLYSREAVTILPHGIVLISTGLAFELPVGYEGQIRPRSGLAFKAGVTVLNAPGTLDSDYRGELKVMLVNHSNSTCVINRGDRIAQLVIQRVEFPTLEVVAELNTTIRGEGGFGSTGK